MTEQDNKGRGARPLRQWLRHEASTLERIRGHARNIDRLQRQLQRRLPDTLAGRWRLAGVSAEEVTLMAPTPAWAATLRFQQQLVRREIRKLTGVEPRRCRVVVDPPRQARTTARRYTPSPNTIEQLHEAAASQADDRLSASMARLARRLASRDEESDD